MPTTIHITDQGNQTISGIKTFATGIVAPNIVYNTGDQNISGNKTFRDTLSVSSISGISGSTSININAIDNAQEIFGGNYLGGGINLTAGSGNFIGGNINLYAGPKVGIPYHGNISVFGNVGINDHNSSTKSVIIYKTGAVARELNVWVQQSSVDVNNAFSISGVQVTPAIYVDRVNNQNISGVKTFDVFPIVSGNKLITGVDLSSYLTSSTASSTYATITNLASTGSTLVGSITSLSGLFTGYTGALDATFASDTQLYTTGSTLDSKINSLSGNLTSTYATITNLATTGSTLDTKINNLSGYVNSSGSNIVFTTGNQSISGNKSFYGDVVLSGNSNRIGKSHYIQTDPDFVYIRDQNNNIILSSEENILFDGNAAQSVQWGSRSLNDSVSQYALDWENRNLINKNGSSVLYWTGDNIGIGTNIPTEKLQVDGNIRINDGGGLYIFDSPNTSDNRIIWQDSDLLFELDCNNVNNSYKQVGFLFNNGPLGESSLYNFKVALGSQPSILYIPSGRQGYIAIDSDLVATGSNLNNKINNVSGYINSSGSNIVFTTGNQTINGNKTFNNTITIRTISGLSGAGTSNSISLKAIDSAYNIFSSNFAGGNIVLDAGSGNYAGGNIILNAGKAGNTPYGGGVTVNGNVNINGSSEFASRTINIYKTGIAFGIPAAINALTIDNDNISLNAPAGGGAGFGLLISGVQVTPALYVDRINNQIINGLKTFTSGIDIYSGTSPQILRIFNSTGTNSGEFALIGWRNNQFVIGSQQSQSGILRDVVITGNNININGSGALNIFDNTNIVGNLTISGNTTITGHLSAASKSFLIDHPTIIGKKLQYGSLEGPEHGVFVRGKTNENIINLPNYWPALVDENSISVNLTPISAANNIYVIDYNNSRIITNGNNGNYYFYTVYGERKDIPKLTVEF